MSLAVLSRVSLLILYTQAESEAYSRDMFRENLNASRPSEHPPAGGKMSKRLGGVIDCKGKTCSWRLNGFPDGSNIGSTV